MQFLNSFVPKFLKKLDHHLLLKHRLIWETKFHYVSFFGLVALVGTGILGYIFPIGMSMSLPNPWVVGGIVMIPAFILMCFWIYKQYQYSIEGQFGQTFKGLGLSRFTIYTASIILFILPAFQLSNILDNRIADLVTESELKDDIMTLNIGNPYFPSIDNDYYGYTEPSYQDAQDNINVYIDCLYENNGDTDNYCGNYDFTHFWIGQSSIDISESDIMTAFEKEGRFEEFFRSDNDKQHLAYIKNYIATFKKYGGMTYVSPNQVLADFKNKKVMNYAFYTQKEYIESQLDSIGRAQYPIRAKDLAISLRVSLLLVLGLSLLLSTLKSVSLRDFIISVVSLVGVGIGFVISTVMFHELIGRSSGSDSTELWFITTSATVYGFTLFKVYQVNSTATFSRFKTICMVALNLVTPFMLLWAGLCADMLNIIKMNDFAECISTSAYNDDVFVANLIIAGAMLHLFIVQPWLRGKFLRMQSLPKA